MGDAPARLTIGSRGSPLARAQAELVARRLRERFPRLQVDTRVISTEGDRKQSTPIWKLGDKGVWVRAIERALTQRDIDLAVHSLKDVPSDVETPGLVIAAFSAREDPRDVLVARYGATLGDLPRRARIGTSSLRRLAQVRTIRSDVLVTEIRGNVDTRLAKLDGGDYDAVVLAAAGLLRLGRADRITEYLPPETFTPDAGQGILAIQTCDTGPAVEAVREIDDASSRTAGLAERAVVRALGADCHSPVGALATLDGTSVLIRAMAAREDGTQVQHLTVEGRVDEAVALGMVLGNRLRQALQTA